MKFSLKALKVGVVILFAFLFNFLFFNSSLAHIYKCINQETGEIFYTNLKEPFLNTRCELFVRERPKVFGYKKPKSSGSSLLHELGKEYHEWFEKVGENFSIDPALLKAIAKVESSFNPQAISPKGALGLMQLMPETAKLVGVSDPFNPIENLKGAALYLKRLLEEFKDLSLALAAYNAGPEKVKLYRGIPPYPETQNYVKNVLYYYQLFRNKSFY